MFGSVFNMEGINKQSPHEGIKKKIEESYSEYVGLMRLVDRIMPSASLL